MWTIACTISESLLALHKFYYPMIWFEQLYTYALNASCGDLRCLSSPLLAFVQSMLDLSLVWKVTWLSRRMKFHNTRHDRTFDSLFACTYSCRSIIFSSCSYWHTMRVHTIHDSSSLVLYCRPYVMPIWIRVLLQVPSLSMWCNMMFLLLRCDVIAPCDQLIWL